MLSPVELEELEGPDGLLEAQSSELSAPPDTLANSKKRATTLISQGSFFSGGVVEG